MEQRQFEKMKLLFWRYLDGEQRLSLLKECDLIPDSAKKPLPYTIEQAVLDGAEKNKLKR